MSNAFDLSPTAAQSYEDSKVPAIFAPLANATLDRIDLDGVATVLDLACGSGVIVRALADRLQSSAHIVGTDLSAAMIDVARARGTGGGQEVDWVVAPADAIPLDAATFDLIICQQGLQFFPDKPAALGEMFRLLRPGGRLALSCWAGTPPLFSVIAHHLRREVSDRAAQVAVAPFSFSDADMISGMIGSAGFFVQPLTRIDVHRSIPATVDAISIELLATPNESALRRLSNTRFASLAAAILNDLDDFRAEDELKLPQSSWLFQANRRPLNQKGSAQ